MTGLPPAYGGTPPAAPTPVRTQRPSGVNAFTTTLFYLWWIPVIIAICALFVAGAVGNDYLGTDWTAKLPAIYIAGVAFGFAVQMLALWLLARSITEALAKGRS